MSKENKIEYPEIEKARDPLTSSTVMYGAPLGRTDAEEQALADPPIEIILDRSIFHQHLLDCRDIKRIEDEKIKLAPTYNPKISTTPIN